MDLNLNHKPLSELHFDPENPRLPSRLHHADESSVFEYLLLECNLIELMLSIGQLGFFPGEPLLVTPRERGGYIVVEGNRRLGAVKLLHNDIDPPVLPTQVQKARASAKEVSLDELPVLIFPNRSDILSYLGYRHITGIKEWDALAKARYLKQLRERYTEDDDEAHKILAREIGSKAPTVAKLLTGLRVLEIARDTGILSKLTLREDDIPFSLLTTGIGYEYICEFIGLKSPTDVAATELKQPEFEEFFTWVFDRRHGSKTVLGDSRKFDKLAEVVHNEHALKELRRDLNLDQAYLYTAGPEKTLRSLMQEAERSISGAQNILSITKGFDPADLAQAERIKRLAIALHAAILSLANPTTT